MSKCDFEDYEHTNIMTTIKCIAMQTHAWTAGCAIVRLLHLWILLG